MEKSQNIIKESKVPWISLTGYRILYVLKLLMEKSRTKDELIEILSKNPYTNKSLSEDTIRGTINTLRAVGCNISSLNKNSGYKYELYSHPFILQFSDDELKALLKMRNSACDNLSWEKILILDEVFNKIISLVCDEESVNKLESANTFVEIDKNILYQLASPNMMGKKIKIEYFSPKNGKEVFDIIVGKISFTEGKLYLSCFNYKYNANSLLNIERIKQIKTVFLQEEKVPKYMYEVVFELFGDSALNYTEENYDRILKKTDKSIVIQSFVNNEFCFIQRLLLYGADFKIISPDSFREKLINKIKLIQKGYEND